MEERNRRARLVEAMDTVIGNMAHEEAYEDWIHFVPDGATEEDFADIAADRELFEAACGIFPKIMGRYARHGWTWS